MGFGMSLANVQHFFQLVGNKLIMKGISSRCYGRGLCLKAKDKAKDLSQKTRTQLFVLEAPRGRRQVFEDTSLFGSGK